MNHKFIQHDCLPREIKAKWQQAVRFQVASTLGSPWERVTSVILLSCPCLASAVNGNIQAGWIHFLTRLWTDLDSFLEIQDTLFLKPLNFSHPSLVENIIYPITACGKWGEGEADGIWIQGKNYFVSLLFSSITDNNFPVNFLADSRAKSLRDIKYYFSYYLSWRPQWDMYTYI